MKVQCKDLNRAVVVEVPNKDMTKKRNSASSFAPRVKRPPNKQYKELKKQGKELFVSPKDSVVKWETFDKTWEDYRARQIRVVIGCITRMCANLEEWVTPDSQMANKHKMLLESQLGQMTRKVTVNAEDIHAETLKKGKK